MIQSNLFFNADRLANRNGGPKKFSNAAPFGAIRVDAVFARFRFCRCSFLLCLQGVVVCLQGVVVFLQAFAVF